MKKVLLTATVQSHIAQFHKPLINMLKDKGYEVHIAAKNNLAEKNGLQIENADRIYDVPFARSPKSMDNIKAYKELKRIIAENNYEIIHANTPMGGVVTRLASFNARKKGTKVFYTAHGFHFFKGASIINWLFYFPVEWLLSFVTDCLICINDEDFKRAKKCFNAKKTEYIPGVGVNPERYMPVSDEEKSELRKKFGYNDDEFIIICTGELNKNKNQSFLIDAFSTVAKNNVKARLLLAGNGPNRDKLYEQVKRLELEDCVDFLGYTTILEKYLELSDLIVSVSIREGLGLNVIEGMLCKKPIIASINRGHKDLINNGENGYLVDNFDEEMLAEKIGVLINDSEKYKKMSENSLKTAQKFTVYNSIKELERIYGF